MDMILDSYLNEEEFEKVRQFNHSPGQFDFEKHTQESITKFRDLLKLRKAKRTIEAQQSLGPQKHSKPGSPMIPGQTEHFVIDEIKK